MSLKLSARRVNNVCIVDLSGRVTMGDGSAELREALRKMASEGQSSVLLNLAELTYIDSSGIGVLVSSFATLRSQNGRLKLLNLTSRVKDLLLITKLYAVFEIFDDEAVALDSFSDASVDSPAVRALGRP